MRNQGTAAADSRRLGAHGRRLLTATVLAYAGTWWLGLFHHLTGEHAHSSLPSVQDVLHLGSLLWPAVMGIVGAATALCDRAASRSSLKTGQEPSSASLGPALAALGAALVLGATVPLGSLLGGVHAHAGLSLRFHLLRDTIVALSLCLPVALATWHLAGLRIASPTDRQQDRDSAWTPARRRRAMVAAGSSVSILLACAGQLFITSPATAAPTGVCSAATRTISYDVVAMEVDLPLNGWGDHIADGKMFALSNSDATPNAADIKGEPGKATPLLLRAAVGDCIKVHFRNEISGKRVGMHVDGVAKAVTGPEASDGARIGYNDDSTAAYGADRTYTWFAQREGQFPINDYGSGTDYQLTDSSDDTTSRGLYGGLVVLPAGFTWHDPTTGRNLLENGHGVGAPVIADARGPGKADDFRDVAMVFMDEPEDVCAPARRSGSGPGSDGGTDTGTTDPAAEPVDPAEAVDPAEPVDPADGAGAGEAAAVAPTFPPTGLVDSTFGFNYRTEPLRNRLQAVLDHRAGKTVTLPNGTVILPEDHFCDGYTNDQDEATNAARLKKDKGLSSCQGEEAHLQSWTFGDHGKMTKAHDKTDVVSLGNAGGGAFTLTLKDPTLMGVLKSDNSTVDTAKARFRGEVATTGPIPFDATPEQVQNALMDLNVLPMAKLAEGAIKVTGKPGAYVGTLGQHFPGRDVELTANVPSPDEVRLTPLDETQPVSATASDGQADGGSKGSIEVLSDALIPHAYRGDPIHMRLIHPGVKETHPCHQHTNRWRQESKDPLSTRLDVQSIGPGQTFDLVYEGGAGEAITEDPTVAGSAARSMAEWVGAGRPDLAALAVSKSSNGDQIFHCHLYPHFAQGFWGALRVFDRQRPLDAAEWPANVPHTYADATPLEPLAMLPDFDLRAIDPVTKAEVRMTQLPDAAHPGYPLMLKGEYLQRAYRAPGAVVADKFGDPDLNWRRPGDTVRDYKSPATTDYERANMLTRTGADGQKHAVPGSFFIDPCPTGAPVREYHPTAIDAKIVYNKAGWNDPGGKLYVEAPPSDPKDASSSIDVAAAIRKKIQAGTVQPEPYNMRSRLGEGVNMRTTNATNLDNDPTVPVDVHDPGGTAFHVAALMCEITTHAHLVRFDELGSDGTSEVWNYVQAPMVGQTWNYRWFVDVALRTVYFHDHQNANVHQQHGMWAAMNVEPTASVWTNPKDGSKLVPPYCNGLNLPTAAQPDGPQTPACYGVGSVSDISVPGVTSFREFTVNYSDFVPLYDAAGKPINPPGKPDDFATHQGGMAINYR